MKYSSLERKDLADCFRRAKTYMWDGCKDSTLVFETREKYICHAIDRTNSAYHVKKMAKTIIDERLNSEKSVDDMGWIGCLENWLIRNVRAVRIIYDSGQQPNSKMLQATRYAWLDSLIEEFSK